MTDKGFAEFFGACDFSRGTEAFAEDLLSQALAAMTNSDEISFISDDDLDMLAAAGNIYDNFDNEDMQ